MHRKKAVLQISPVRYDPRILSAQRVVTDQLTTFLAHLPDQQCIVYSDTAALTHPPFPALHLRIQLGRELCTHHPRLRRQTHPNLTPRARVRARQAGPCRAGGQPAQPQHEPLKEVSGGRLGPQLHVNGHRLPCHR